MTDPARSEGNDTVTRANGRPRDREPVFNIPAVIVVLIALCVGIHVLRLFVFDAGTDFGIVVRFAFIPARWSGNFEIDIYTFVSPFSYAFLHGGNAHLAINSVWLAIFGSPLATRLGTPRFLLFWALTSFAAVFFYFLLQPTDIVPVIGASGAISGMMGAAARFGFKTVPVNGRKRAFYGPVMDLGAVVRSRTVLAFLGVWFGANLLAGAGFLGTGDGARIAWEAHVGGFAAGFFLISGFAGRSPGRPNN